MKRTFLVSVFVLGFLLFGVFQPYRAQPARADDGRTNFTFMTLPKQVNGADTLIFNGHGSFNRDEVEGGGSFTHFSPTGLKPFPIVASGTWKARRLISFTSAGTYGAHEAGVLKMDVDLVVDDRSVVSATVKVVCNIGAGNLQTGQPGGVTLSSPGRPTFVATAPQDGLTVFSTGIEERN